MATASSSESDRYRAAISRPFVGRARELNRFRGVIDRVRDGHGHLVLVSGEAGVGKTTLMKAVIEYLPNASLVLTGHCYDLTVTPPYGPWIEILQTCRRRDDLTLPETLAGDEALATAASQRALFDTFLRFFQHVAADRLLLVMLEDVHWADHASLDLLRYLARQIDQNRILVVVSYRDDEITRRDPLFELLPMLVREASAERLQLRRLEAGDIRELVTVRYNLSGSHADRLARHVSDLSDGNPFFVHELLTTLEDDRILRVETEGVLIGPLEKLRTPPLLKQVIERRLSRLDSTTRNALEVAAVIGQDVPLDVWIAVLQQCEEQLDSVVQAALDHRVLEETSGGSGYAFTHALVRETLIEGIALTGRRRWHRRTAEVLATGPASDPDMVAYHFQQAGDQRAVDWFIQAGERAQRAHAWLSAADRFESAVGLLESRPERIRERGWLLYRISQLRRYGNQYQCIAYLNEALEIASESGDQELLAIARLGRGLLKCFVGDLVSGLPELDAATLAIEQLDSMTLGRVRPGGGLNRGVYALWLALAGHYHDAIVVAQEKLSRMSNSRDPGLRSSHRALATAYSFLGQPNLADQAFAIAYELSITYKDDPPNAYLALMQHFNWFVLPYQAENLVRRQRLLAECDALSDLAKGTVSSLGVQSVLNMPLLMLEGNWDRARDVIADRSAWESAPRGLELNRLWSAILVHHQADVDDRWHRMRELLPAGPALSQGNVTTANITAMVLLVSQLGFEPGDLEIARVWLDAFNHWLEWSGAVLGKAENGVLWSQYHRTVGDLPRARELADRALVFASEPRQPLALIAAHRTVGQLDTVDGRYVEADQHLQASLNLADACVAPFERALTLLELATLRVAEGHADVASVLLGEVIGTCEPLEAKSTLTRATTLLTTLRTSAHSTGNHRGLSTREMDVLRLVAEGLTDREIAASLFISPRTVTTHVSHILNKLGVNTRTEAAAYAVRAGLI